MFKFFKTQNVSFNKANEERVVNLKCEFCGFEMNEGDVFCGKCGKKYENDLCDFTKHKYIWMGQLLGVLLEQNQYKYTIDLGKENIGLTYEMLRVWAQIIAPKDIAEKDSEIISELINRGCILDLNISEHLDRFMSCIPYRQGVGAVLNNKHAIMLGTTPTYPTDKHLMVWRMSDGRKSIKDILENTYLKKDDYLDVLCELIMYNTIYVKYI